MNPSRLTRRAVLRAAAGTPFATSAAAQDASPRIAGKRPMLVHNDFPEDLEALPEYLATWITPIDAFFVRQHLPRPTIQVGAFRLVVGGMVESRLDLGIQDLRDFPQFTVPATLECAGNGRNNFRPRVPGLQWSKGAIGNAEWRGPRLRDVLAKARASSAAAFADFNGADNGLAKTPDFIRSIPMRKLLHDSTILALSMNGQPLPELHGGPVRLIVPGWDGASWVKWVNSIELTAQPNAGFYMNPAYRYPRFSVAPGGTAKPEEMDVIEGMVVKSFFATPSDGAKVRLGLVSLKGIAWGGEERIAKVEISTDGGARWSSAAVGREDYRFAWRTWNYNWKPVGAGYHTLCVRATDLAGHTQPIEPAWNPSGYLWNGIERIGVMVES